MSEPVRSAVSNKPYKYQPFPAAMYHEDGRNAVVISEEDAAARCPVKEGWQSKPFPPKPVPVPVPELTVPQLKAKLAKVTEDHDKLTAVCAEQMLQISELQAKVDLKVGPAVLIVEGGPEVTLQIEPPIVIAPNRRNQGKQG